VKLKLWSAAACAGACLVAVSANAVAAPTAPPRPIALKAVSAPAGRTDPLPSVGQTAPGRASLAPAGSGGSWTNVDQSTVPFGFYPGSMLLLTDGSVLVHTDDTDQWERLTPDASGNYADGTWSSVAPSCFPAGNCSTYYQPQYYASAVLPDGRVFIEGGEYDGTNTEVFSTDGAIYDPAANTWTRVTAPSGWASVGDAESAILANGTLMVADCCDGGNGEALLNASTLAWTATGTGKADSNDEEGWTLLPSGDLLAVDILNAPHTELYNPSTGVWTLTGSTVDPVTDVSGYEEGPDLLLPGTASVLAVGAGDVAPSGPDEDGEDATQSYSDVYDTNAGTWSRGPLFPKVGGYGYDVADGPGAVLPDGDALVMASPGIYETPSLFYDIRIDANSASDTITQVASPDGATDDSSFYGRMLDLPNGQVLWDDSEGDMAVYSDPGQPLSGWKPTIGSAPAAVVGGSSYTVSGTQLSGLDQGAAYGDDNQDATNYPLVRITNQASGAVTYATTSGFSSYSIAPGASSSASFKVPTGTPSGASTLQVVANGIASAPSNVWVGGPQCGSVSANAAAGIAGQLHLSCDAGAGDQLNYTVVSAPAHGTLGTPGSDGSISYTAAAGFAGSDSFTYRATDSLGSSAVETVSVAVAQPPTCTALNATAPQGKATSITLSCSDPKGGALSYAVLTQPAHGTLAGATGSSALSYTPASGYAGTDQFTYRATAADGVSSTATVLVTVAAKAPSVSLQPPKVTATKLTVPVTCSNAPTPCVVQLRLIYVEHINKRVHHGHRTVTKKVTRTVTIGSATQTAAGGSARLTLALNATGRRLLKTHATLRATLLASSSSGVVSKRSVVIKRGH
jgi:hypothetical protein